MITSIGGFVGAGLVPLDRLGTPEDVAAAVTFLCSDAASFITGEVIDVNGGILIDYP